MNHANSIPLLDALWKLNQPLMISAISEVFRRENSSLNLSRVLDITQEIKDSLLPIVNCKDINFSVSLGILAGKRDFLHFDQWINERIKTLGDEFVLAILNYIDENIIK
jgi:CCR4-NOT transcription complex subunit 1